MPNWSDVLKEINKVRDERLAQAKGAVDIVRRRYLRQLYKYTGRNVIAYYSGFLSKPGIAQDDINDEDKNGFMMAVHRLDRKKGLDLILHTPGGNIAATQSIADYLHKMFDNNIRAIVPQIAMSAGTMLACSCRKIVMATHSNLGPIDPQLGSIPAYGVIKEFERACKEVKDDPSKAAMWHAIISQYRPTFLSQCQNAIDWSYAFVQEQLETCMFSGQSDAKTKAKQIVDKLTDYSGNKTHSRHIHYEECHEMGLEVERLEDDDKLQDLVLTVHHSFMHSLMNTQSYKMIENHLGIALVKQQTQVIQQVIQQG
jgi:ClpP class serine protease